VNDTTYLDSVVLHSPLRTFPQTLEAWRTLESYIPSGTIRHLGISNVTLPVLKALHDAASTKPAVVQNRFHRPTSYDVPLRRFCRANGIVYQSFWTLTGNPTLLKHTSVVRLAGHAGISKESALYALVLAMEGTTVLNGTTSHMVEDLAALEAARKWASAEENAYECKDIIKHFRDAIGENDDQDMPEENATVKIKYGDR